MTSGMTCAFLAGLGGGLLSTIASHPFDTVKVVQQTLQIQGLIPCYKLIVASSGPSALFAGMSLPMVSSGLMNAMFFASYEATGRALEGKFYKKHLAAELRRLQMEGQPPTSRMNFSDWTIVAAGGLAGASQIIVGCPVETIKVKLQAYPIRPGNTDKPMGSISLAKMLIRKYGVLSLYQGTTLMLMREVPSSMVYMYTYQHMTIYLQNNKSQVHRAKPKNDKPKVQVPFIAGGVAGTLSAILSMPFDVVKSRVQATSYKDFVNTRLREHFQSLYRQQGLVGFTRGYKALLIRAFPINGAAFVAYEWFMQKCHAHKKRDIVS